MSCVIIGSLLSLFFVYFFFLIREVVIQSGRRRLFWFSLSKEEGPLLNLIQLD